MRTGTRGTRHVRGGGSTLRPRARIGPQVTRFVTVRSPSNGADASPRPARLATKNDRRILLGSKRPLLGGRRRRGRSSSAIGPALWRLAAGRLRSRKIELHGLTGDIERRPEVRANHSELLCFVDVVLGRDLMGRLVQPVQELGVPDPEGVTHGEHRVPAVLRGWASEGYGR